MLSVGSLFAGIGGFDLGFERAGMRTAWLCEQNQFGRAVLANRFPGVPCYSDVRELTAATVEPVDVLCGGFPCQDLSTAGNGAGIDGERSGLWSEMFRLACELRPRYLVVENVSALLTGDGGAWMRRVLGDLAAGGFDAEWDCLPASAVGAPHRRDRVWIVAYPVREGLEGHGRAGRDAPQVPDVGSAGAAQRLADAQGAGREARERNGLRAVTGPVAGPPARSGGAGDVGDPEGDGRGQGRQGRPVAAGAGERVPVGSLQDADGSALLPWRVGGRIAQAGGAEWWAVEPPVGRVAHGVPDRLDQLAALGNALVPQIAEWIGRRIIDFEESELAA